MTSSLVSQTQLGARARPRLFPELLRDCTVPRIYFLGGILHLAKQPSEVVSPLKSWADSDSTLQRTPLQSLPFIIVWKSAKIFLYINDPSVSRLNDAKLNGANF